MTMTALVEEHSRQRQSLFEQVMRLLLGLWGWQATVHDPVLVNGAIAATAYQVDIAMEAARRQEVAFFTAYAEELGVPYSGADLLTEPIYARDADLVDVYSRFIDEFRWQRFGRQNAARSEDVLDEAEAGVDGFDPDAALPLDLSGGGGAPLVLEVDEAAEYEAAKAADEAAFQEALDRLEKIVKDDLNLASADTHRQLIEKKDVWLGYRRVIHPELSETGTCGLCVAAATRIYSRRDRLPMHTLCKCTMLGVTAESDPGKAMNDADVATIAGLFMSDGAGGSELVDFDRDDLERLYAIAGSKGRAQDMKEVRFETWEHGEKGPTIAWTRGRSDRPHRSQSLADSRAMWSRTADWAHERRREAVTAGGRTAAASARDRYAQVVAHYDELIARMEHNMKQRFA